MAIRMRYILVASFIVLCSALIMSSAFKTTVVYAKEWNDKANRELSEEVLIKPQRGNILAADGSVLATDLLFYKAYIDFRASKFMTDSFRVDLPVLADTLAKVYPHYTKEEWESRFNAQLNRAPEKRRSFLFLRNLTFEQAQELKKFPFFRRSANCNRTGLVTESYMKRRYPYGDMARRSIGRVGQTAECSDIHGRSGLEYALDTLLFGKPGYAKKVPLTHRIVNWTDRPPQNGYTVTTTIDIAMQDIVENELNDMLRTTEAEWGTALLMEVETGDIKAISNLERDSTGNYIEAMNYALQAYEPGSVMKVISMVVAVEDGFVHNLNELYTIPGGGYVYGGGSPIRDTHSPGVLPVGKFLCYSSNIGMTKLVAPHFEHDPNLFRERLRQLGFLDTLHTGIAGERPPYFPTLDLESGGKVSLGRQTYGYASMIPPLYTCAFYNAVANDGKFVRPRIYSKLTDEHGDSILPVTYVRKQMCSPQTAQTVRAMMHDVIYEQGGTARMLKNDFVEFAGKTGTARIAPERKKATVAATDSTGKKQSGYSNKLRLAFCGFFPYDKPRYTCMVLISSPAPQYRGAGYTSGMVFRNIAMKMYSRGMLGNGSDYHLADQAAKGTRPTVFANTDRSRVDALKEMLGTPVVQRMQSPRQPKRGVPDVRSLSVRDAIQALERRGYNVAVNGTGYVASQSLAPGTPAKAGTRVELTLRN